jgi:hypothetical protein
MSRDILSPYCLKLKEASGPDIDHSGVSGSDDL